MADFAARVAVLQGVVDLHGRGAAAAAGLPLAEALRALVELAPDEYVDPPGDCLRLLLQGRELRVQLVLSRPARVALRIWPVLVGLVVRGVAVALEHHKEIMDVWQLPQGQAWEFNR